MTSRFRKKADALLKRISLCEEKGALLKACVVKKQLSEFLKKFKIRGYDWDGCVLASEPLMIIAITNVYNAQNGDNEDWTVADMAKRVTGIPLDKVFEYLIKDCGMTGTVADAMTAHTEEYLRIIHDYKLLPNEAIRSDLSESKKTESPYCFILTNGNKQAILQLLEENNLKAFDAVHGTERSISDKVKFAKQLVESQGLSMSDLVWFDDSVKTIRAMEQEGVTCVYVRHEFNDKDFVPESGIVIDGYASALYADYPFLCSNIVRPMTVGGKWNRLPKARL